MDSSEVRLQAMEDELLANRAKTNTIQLALQSIMSKLEINTEKPRDKSKVNFAFAEEGKGLNSSTGHVKIKLASPSDFDGDQEKEQAFLNTCCSVCGDLFQGDQAHIHWALLFFKSDQAACFAGRVMRLEQKSGRWNYKDLQAFKQEFEELFCVKYEQLAALTKLEGMSWYQGKDSVEDYIDQFLELVELAEYSDDKTIIMI